MKHRVVLLAVLLGAVSAPASAQDAQRIINCMRANIPPALRVQKIELSYSDPEGQTRVMKGRFFEMRDKTASGRPMLQMMLRIDAPEDLAGAAYLVQQSEDPAQGGLLAEGLYVYLPSVKAVRRVTGETADGPLLGTNFSYNDLKDITNAFEGSVAIIEPTSQAYSRPANVISFTPVGPTTQASRAARVWVDQKSCLPLKVDYYEGKKLRKQMTTPDFALNKDGAAWRLSEIDMSDLKDGSTTVLKFVGTDKPSALPRKLFDPATFYLTN